MFNFADGVKSAFSEVKRAHNIKIKSKRKNKEKKAFENNYLGIYM